MEEIRGLLQLAVFIGSYYLVYRLVKYTFTKCPVVKEAATMVATAAVKAGAAKIGAKIEEKK